MAASVPRSLPDLPLLRRWWWVPIVLTGILSAVPQLFGEHWPSDAPYYQAISTEMARDGGAAWWSPMQGDLHYFNKPPLAFWVHGAMVSVCGDVDWAARAPEGVFYVLTCLVVGWLARRLHGPGTGMLAGYTLALTSEWVRCIGNFRLEFLHTLLLLAACACWVKAFVPREVEGGKAEASRIRGALLWSLVAGVCIGGALMTKPLIGLALPILGLAWVWMSGLLTRRVGALLALSGVVGVLVALPWHASMISRYGETFARAYFWEQSFQRATGELFHARPWDWYFRLIGGRVPQAISPGFMVPIYAGALVGLAVVVLRWGGRAARAGDALAALWTLGWFVALCAFSGKQNYYLLVVHPGAAWLGAIAAGALMRWSLGSWSAASIRRGARILVLLWAFSFGVVVAFLPNAIARHREQRLSAEQRALMEFIRSNREKPVYNAGLWYPDAALIYLKTSVWPRSIVEKRPVSAGDTPAGALLVYREDHPATPSADPADPEVFAAPVGGSMYTVRRRHAPGDRP